MPQDMPGQRWSVAAICRAVIKDVVIGALGVAILALPIFSLDIVVNQYDGLFGRDLPLDHWVALPVILTWAVAGGIYIAACNFGLLPRLVIAVMIIATAIGAVFVKILAAFAIGAAIVVLPALLLGLAGGGFLIITGSVLWLAILLGGPIVVAMALGADPSF